MNDSKAKAPPTPAQLAHYERMREVAKANRMSETKTDETSPFNGLSEEQKARLAHDYAEAQGLELVSKAVAGVKVIDPATPDTTGLDYLGTGLDPWMGAIIEPGWKHSLVPDPPSGSGLPSNKLKYQRMGYKIAPAPADILAEWNENRRWVMRLPQAVYDARVAKSREDSLAQRVASHETDGGESGLEVTQSTQAKKALAELMNG